MATGGCCAKTNKSLLLVSNRLECLNLLIGRFEADSIGRGHW